MSAHQLKSIFLEFVKQGFGNFNKELRSRKAILYQKYFDFMGYLMLLKNHGTDPSIELYYLFHDVRFVVNTTKSRKEQCESIIQQLEVFIEKLNGQILEINQLLIKSSNLYQKLLSSEELSEEDKFYEMLLVKYCEIVFKRRCFDQNMREWLESINLERLRIDNIKKKLCAECSFLKNTHESIFDEIVWIIYESSYQGEKRLFTSPGEKRKLTPKEHSAIQKFNQRITLYLKQIDEKFQEFQLNINMLVTEIESHQTQFNSISERFFKIAGSSLFEFMKMIVQGNVCDEFNQCLKEYDELNSSIQQTRERHDSKKQKFSNFENDEIKKDILEIQADRCIYQEYRDLCKFELKQRGQTKNVDTILRSEALSILNIDRIYKDEEKSQKENLFLKLVTISDLGQLTEEELKIRMMMFYISPSLACEVPIGNFPQNRIPEPTACD